MLWIEHEKIVPVERKSDTEPYDCDRDNYLHLSST